MTPDPWDARMAQARAAVGPAALLAGDWVGEAVAHGEPCEARLRVRVILDGTMVEASERVGSHEDRCFYRWDFDTSQLRVLHLLPGALLEDHPVELVPDGLVWVTGPTQPAVEWTVQGEALRCAVTFPGAREPEVLVRYVRA